MLRLNIAYLTTHLKYLQIKHTTCRGGEHRHAKQVDITACCVGLTQILLQQNGAYECYA